MRKGIKSGEVEFIVKKPIFLTGFGRLQAGDKVWLNLDQGIRLSQAGWLEADSLETLCEQRYLLLSMQADEVSLHSSYLDDEMIRSLQRHIEAGWNVKMASRKLGISLSTAYRIVRKHGFKYKWNAKILSMIRKEDIVALKLDGGRFSRGIGKDISGDEPG